MSKRSRLTPKKDGSRWRLSVPPKLSPTGKRQNLLYRTQALALVAAGDLRDKREEFGNQARAISPVLADQATAAAALLKPHDITVLEAARQTSAAIALLAPFGITPLQAAERIASMERENLASTPVEDAVSKFQVAKESKSDKQKSAIKHMAKHFCEDFAGRQLSTITGAEIAKHIDDRTSGPSAFNAKLRLFITFWRWAAKSPRMWCKADALSLIDPREAPLGIIGTLTSKQAAQLMATSEKHFLDTVVPFAVALFTGMRQAEINRLEPEDFTSEGITVPAINDRKNNRRRFIEIPAPLAAWLKEYPITDSVIPANWQRKYDAVRRLAGWKIWSDLVPTLNLEPKMRKAPEDHLPAWPANALRHTAATVVLALGKPIEKLIFEHGHTEGVEMLRSHYIGKITKKDALAIWAIGPKGRKIPFLKIA